MRRPSAKGRARFYSSGNEAAAHAVALFALTGGPGQPDPITFVNHDRGALGVYWLNYQGDLQWYETLVPKQSVVQHTFKNNPWVMLNSSFSCVSYVNPTGQAKYIVH